MIGMHEIPETTGMCLMPGMPVLREMPGTLRVILMPSVPGIPGMPMLP